MLRSILTLVALVCFVGTLTASDIPYMVNVQGKLTDSGGTPLPDGDYVITFTIYDACEGGSSVWQQTRMVEIVDALFAEILGEDDNVISGDVDLPLDVFNAAVRCLGIKVGGDQEMIPRQRIVAMPYAYYAETADHADTANYAFEAGQVEFADSADVAAYAYAAAGWIDEGWYLRLLDPLDFVAIGSGPPQEKLDVDGRAIATSFGFKDSLYHFGDENTYMHFTIDQTDFYDGGVRMLTLDETTQDKVEVNPDGGNVDFRVQSDNDSYALFVNADNDRIGIGTNSPDRKVRVDGDVRIDGSIMFEFDYDSGWFYVSSGSCSTKNHNLGGNADNYIVIVDGKNGDGIHQAHFGTCIWLVPGQWRGVEWKKLDENSITVCRGAADNQADEKDWDNIRVRIIANQ